MMLLTKAQHLYPEKGILNSDVEQEITFGERVKIL